MSWFVFESLCSCCAGACARQAAYYLRWANEQVASVFAIPFNGKGNECKQLVDARSMPEFDSFNVVYPVHGWAVEVYGREIRIT